MSAPLPQRFRYFEADPLLGSVSALPYAPITLQLGDRRVQVSALIDSGATLNVLPFDVGVQLGAAWEKAGRAHSAWWQYGRIRSARPAPHWARWGI